MKFGLFAMPAHPPERDLKQGFEWDLQVIRWLDELGYGEAWVGEHHTVPWEPNPAPAVPPVHQRRGELGPWGAGESTNRGFTGGNASEDFA